jgi:eukaryotic-like serine/threonine-protein kinase
MVEVGDTINAKYHVVRLIGEGGMGTVYEAHHELLGISVALKFLHPDIAEQGSLKQRFMQEARVSASIRNPHIVRILDVDAYEGSAFLVMELLEGEPLSRRLERTSALPLSTAFQYMLQILDGVAAAHALNIVHRDLKPDNVFITQLADGGALIRILDFGIAKLRQSNEYKMTLTRPGAVMGTPEYMAPEQAYSADLADARSDVYSLGVIMFEMLSGKLPVEGDNPQQIAEQILTGKVKHLENECAGLAPGLVKVIHVAMSADPDHRWRDAAAVRDALLPFLPKHAPASEGEPLLSSSAFAAISKTPRIDGSMAPSVKPPQATRIEGGAKGAPVAAAAGIAVQRPSSPATEAVRERTAPPDSGPNPALQSQAQRTISMPGRRAKPGVNVRPTPRTRNPRLPLVVAAVISLAVGAGVGLQIYFTRGGDVPEPPRPVRRVMLVPPPAAEAQDEAFDDEEDEGNGPPFAQDSNLPVRAASKPNPESERQVPTPPIATFATPSSPTSAPNWVTIPAIPLPQLPTGITFPTSLPVSVPTFLPFPQPPQ